MLALTLPRFRVKTKTKWEVNIMRKYQVASSAIVSQIIRTLRIAALDFFARKMNNEKARRSDVCMLPTESVSPDLNSR